VPALTFGLGVVVERWVESALRPARRLSWTTIVLGGCGGLSVAAVVGAALARSLASRVRHASTGARTSQGKLDAESRWHSNDELGELAKAFNSMASVALGGAQRDPAAQRRDPGLERHPGKAGSMTRPQNCATPRISCCARARSRPSVRWAPGSRTKINNPLTGVLGLAQILLADLPEGHPVRR